MNIQTVINGKKISVNVKNDMRLLDFLRDELELTGTKEGCSEGECGACTVLIDGSPVNSCLVMAFQIDGKEVVTIEALDEDGNLNIIKDTFLEEGAPQCGFCMPGMVLSAKGLLDQNSNPTRSDVKEAISGNLCRCTGYTTIEDAILKSAKKLGGKNG
ncbi:(2Fe-2S)-binding protein [Mycoplasmatota bacterium]|nr:(2Fe-2S)-binding protein [Mycoplasmatota bacterium]